MKIILGKSDGCISMVSHWIHVQDIPDAGTGKLAFYEAAWFFCRGYLESRRFWSFLISRILVFRGGFAFCRYFAVLSQ